MFTEIDGLKLRYDIAGEGEPVVLLHGWGSSLDAFVNIKKVISKKYKVISLDFPGFGQSDMPKSAWNVEDYASITLEFFDFLGIKDPILVGHSFGGRVIMKLCGTGRVSPSKIILLDAAGVKHKRSFKSKCKTAAFKAVKKVLTVGLWKKPCEPVLQKARARFGSADYNSAPPVLRETLVKVVNEDLTDLLENITASTLLIYGENDTDTPVSDARIIESRIKDSGLCIIKGAGHWAFAEKPGEVLAIIKSFLQVN